MKVSSKDLVGALSAGVQIGPVPETGGAVRAALLDGGIRRHPKTRRSSWLSGPVYPLTDFTRQLKRPVVRTVLVFQGPGLKYPDHGGRIDVAAAPECGQTCRSFRGPAFDHGSAATGCLAGLRRFLRLLQR
jgi:hypothetical protein